MKTIDVHQVDSFTTRIFGGNPAGVVTDAASLTDTEMKNVAREMNLSETAFVLPATSADADVRLRFFTPPGDEIKFCGHATIGALFQLSRLNMFKLGETGQNNIRVETKAGVLVMTVVNMPGEQPRITFTPPKVQLQAYGLQGQEFADAFGVDPALIKTNAQIFVDTVLNYVYIPTVSLQKLRAQSFNFDLIRKRFDEEGVVVFCFYSNETIASEAHLYARGLAPNVGVNEDPFTGSMQCGLVHAAKQNEYIGADQTIVITEQGHDVHRPGMALIMHDSKTDSLLVTADAAQVFSTKMEL